MEPTNNPQPTADPNATAAGAAATPPVAPIDAMPGVGAAAPATPGVDATAPVAAVPGVDAAASSATVSGIDTMTTPEAPVVGAGAPAAAPAVGAATNPVVGVPDTTGLVSPSPVGGGLDGLPMTEPIMRPDLPPAPDPVKQELEAPMKAAAPVPGSIGSAVSVPEGGEAPVPGADAQFGPSAGGSTPSVSFDDPAAQNNPQQPGAPATKEKKKMSFNLDFKKMNKGTLIALIVVAVMIVIGLAAVLIMQFM